MLWTISPDPQERLESFRQQNGFEFPMLFDPELEVIRAWGILNEDSGKIPHPTAVIVNSDGVMTYVRVDENFMVRPPTAEELIPALQAAGR